MTTQKHDALLDWGSDNDPCKIDFYHGWDDQEAGRVPNPPPQLDRSAAYNSGYIASRERRATNP